MYESAELTNLLADTSSNRSVRGEFLTSILASRRALRIEGAIISGQFNLAGISVDVPIELNHCRFENPPVFDGAHLRSLKLSGSTCPGLSAANVRVDGNLLLDDGFTSTRKITLEDARIGGKLGLSNAVLGVAPENASTAKDSEMTTPTEVRADGTPAHIEAVTDEALASEIKELERAQVVEQNTEDTNEDTILGAARLRVAGSLLAKNLEAHGKVELISARIDGLLSLMGAQLSNPGRMTLQGERLRVGESIFLQRKLSSDGCLFFRNASVEGGIDLADATLTARVNCVNLMHASVGRNVSFRRATIDGSVQLTRAKVGSGVNFKDARFTRRSSALVANRLSASTLQARFRRPPLGILLRYASLDVVEDDISSWPEALRLDGCNYRMLDSATDVKLGERLDWLRRDTSHYKPFRYDELMASYRNAGDEAGASRVGLEKQRCRTRTLPWWRRLWGYLQDITVGYGYRNGLALIWVFGFIVIGPIVFSCVPPIRAKDKAPPFDSTLYSADLLLPVVNLGVKDYFVPIGETQLVAAALRIAGWMLTTVIVAGITRLLNRPAR